MDKVLTTITPVWGRPEMLEVWMKAVKGATVPGMKHIVFFVGEPPPDSIKMEYEYDTSFQFVYCPDDVPGEWSIGHYHNLGARLACTEWMMKLDVDALPNVRYFKELLRILEIAGPKDWFNGGMMYVTQNASAALLSAIMMPVSEDLYQTMMHRRHVYFGPMSTGPAATNFICRREVYLKLGGCDERFRGYGWEDYQQIYMLEKHRLGTNPLPGVVTMENVTRRCCREISRRRARELFERSFWLCLLHRWHLSSSNTNYKSHEIMLQNRKILLDYILHG